MQRWFANVLRIFVLQRFGGWHNSRGPPSFVSVAPHAADSQCLRKKALTGAGRLLDCQPISCCSCRNLGAGASALLTDADRLTTLIAGLSVLALGIYSAREGTRVAGRAFDRSVIPVLRLSAAQQTC